MSTLSEAESIVAKYSALKPLLSRPSAALAAQRFGVDGMTGVASAATAAPLSASTDTTQSTVSNTAPVGRSPSIRIVQTPRSGALLTAANTSTPTSSSHLRPTDPSFTQGTPDYSATYRDTSPARAVTVVSSPKRQIRKVDPVVSLLPAERAAAVSGADPGQLEALREVYGNNVAFFSEVAREERGLTLQLQRDNSRLQEELVQAGMLKEHVEQDGVSKVAATQEHCSRHILNLRKTLILSEQTSGSLRSENESLFQRAVEADTLRDEVEELKRKNDDLDKKLILLAQQNSALQRALKQKESDCRGDLDLYVKQLELVQSQNAAFKKEMEIMAFNARQQQSLEKEIERLKSKNAELQQTVQSLDKEVGDMQEKTDLAVREKEDECAREILNYRRQAVKLEEQLKTAQAQLEAHIRRQRPSVQQKDMEELAKKVEQLSAVLVEQEHQKRNIEEVAQRLDDDLRRAKRTVDEVTAAYRKVVAELATERQSHQIVRAELDQVTASLSKAVADVQIVPVSS